MVFRPASLRLAIASLVTDLVPLVPATYEHMMLCAGVRDASRASPFFEWLKREGRRTGVRRVSWEWTTTHGEKLKRPRGLAWTPGK